VIVDALRALAALGAVADGGFLPVGQLGWEFLIGLGGALALGNVWALVRPGVVERRTGTRQPRPPAPGRVRRNAAIGMIVAAVGILGLAGAIGHS
jgi:hypothetical protein